MAGVNKQRDRFDKYSVLLLRFCNARILSKEVTNFFSDRIVRDLIEHDVFTLRDFLSLNKNDARSVFKSSDSFKDAVNVLNNLCINEIPNEFNQYRVGKAYLLIEPFDVLHSIIDKIGDKEIDYKYTDFSGVKVALKTIGIVTYSNLLSAGPIKVGGIKGFGEKGYSELAKIIYGEAKRIETGKIVYTKKWIKTEDSKVTVSSSDAFDIKLIKQDPKVKQIHINAINRLHNHISKLIGAKETTFLNKKLKETGVSPYCYNYAYKVGLNSLNEIFNSLNKIAKLYSYTQKRLKNLADNVAKVSMAKLKNSKKKTTKSSKKVSPSKKIKTKSKVKKTTSVALLNRISERAGENCCLCLKLGELLKITEKDFISLMKKQYPYICDFKLESGKIRSWRDEYNQFTKTFIPIFRKHDKDILNFFVIFELKLPKFRTDLDSEEFIYSDAVIVGDDGFVILEFKQREVVALDQFSSQALKYIKRLRFHNIGRTQSFRYTYLVFTQEPEDKVWIYDDREDYWYGNPKGIALDMCTEFFDNNNPYDDIEEWLTAGFREKHRK